jgi:hypothetical protein
MFTSTGILQYDPGKGTKSFNPHWALLICDDDIARYYAWHMKKHGVELYPNNKGLWGTHVSSLKGEPVLNQELWGKYEGYEVEFHYNHLIRYDNGRHAWVDVYSEDLSKIREELGFAPKYWYHLTIGRLVRPFDIKEEELVPMNPLG